MSYFYLVFCFSLLSFHFRSIPLGRTSAYLRAIGVSPLQPIIPCSLGMKKTFSWGESQAAHLVPHTR